MTKRSKLLASTAAAALALPIVTFAPQAQAKKLNWNEIQECIYLPFDMQKVREEYAVDRQRQALPVLINQYESQCVKGKVSQRDYEIVCSIPANNVTAFCGLLHDRFAGR